MSEEEKQQREEEARTPEEHGAGAPPEHLDLNPEQVNEIDGEFERLMRAQRLSMADLKEHFVGPTVSLVAHLIVIIWACTMVVSKPPQEAKEIEVEMKEVDIKKFEPPPEPPPVEQEVDLEIEVEIDRPQAVVAQTESVNVDASTVSVETPDVVVDIPDLLAVKPNKSMLKMPKLFSARTGKGRVSAMKKYGGSQQTEAAVVKALEWLAKNQNDDGSWGVYETTKIQYTALALLAFLGHGETPMSEKYGRTIVKAIGKMMQWGDQYKNSRYIPSSGYTYNHPAVVYSLAESYGLTRMPKVKVALNNLIRAVITGYNKHGAYWPSYSNYIIFPGRNPLTGEIPLRDAGDFKYHCDTAFTTWNCQALKSAYAAGCDAENLEKCMLKSIEGVRYIGKTRGVNRDFGEECMLTLSLGFLGEGSSKESKDGIKFLEKDNKSLFETCSWQFNPELFKKYPKAYTNAVFVWYWQTQVAFQMTKGVGPLWKKWVREFSKALVREQESDGHWSTPAQKYGKGKIPENASAEWTSVIEYKDEKDLNIYSTVYCCLTLEVFYRYLPTYKLNISANKKEEKKKEDDLGLKVF